MYILRLQKKLEETSFQFLLKLLCSIMLVFHEYTNVKEKTGFDVNEACPRWSKDGPWYNTTI